MLSFCLLFLPLLLRVDAGFCSKHRTFTITITNTTRPTKFTIGGVAKSCTVTFMYHNLAGSDDRDIKRSFKALFPSDGSALRYQVTYTDHGGNNKEGGHKYKDSYLMFDDAAGKARSVSLVDNSGSAHYARNLRFSKSCPMQQGG